MPEELAIKVDHISKDFILPHDRATSIKGVVTSLTRGRSWKTKETQHALHDISLEVKKGEFFGVVGRNGSGKSTLLKMLAGIYQPTNGSIAIDGRLVPFIELGVGFNPELTGRENVYLNGAMLGFSKRQVDSMYGEIVTFAELNKFMDQKLKNYSSGMQVRLAFSMAVRSEADILLVDEVLAVGDTDFQKKCFAYFKQLKRDKKTVVFVSHDMDSIREYCDRAILIENSRLKLQGSAEKVATAYSRLFFEEEARLQKTNQDRWGDQSAKITDIRVSPNPVEDGSNTISLQLTIQASENIDEPVIGFLIKNQSSQPILGTNTNIEGLKLPPMKKGRTLTTSWEIPHVFARGLYYVDPSIIDRGTTAVHDWWEEATSFVVHKEKVTPYLVNPSMNVKVKAAQAQP
jgi:ABC-2 type transport system ATP-binding protein